MSDLVKVQTYLQTIDEVIEKGPFKDNWESLSRYGIPEWYAQAKFGLFVHWGVYSVPAYFNEWYSREMYQKGHPARVHHLKTYGKDFGYKDFIPQFTAEKYDPKAWADLFAESGAKYVTPVGEHHDGFKMYPSELCEWNAVKMGPKRDIYGELKRELETRGVKYCSSSHRAEHYWFMNGGRELPGSDVQEEAYREFYGPAGRRMTQAAALRAPSSQQRSGWRIGSPPPASSSTSTAPIRFISTGGCANTPSAPI